MNNIIITNKTIIDFFTNSNLNIEDTLLSIIELFKKINSTYQKNNFDDLLKNINYNISTTNKSLIDEIKNIKFYINDSINSINDKLNSSKNENNEIFNDKLNQLHKQYINDIKLLFIENNNCSVDKIILNFEKENINLECKLKVFLNEYLPKNNNDLYLKITNDINKLIDNELKYIHNQNTLNNDSINLFISNIDIKMNELLNKFNNERINEIIKQNNNFIEEKIQFILHNIHNKESINFIENIKKYINDETNLLLKNTVNNNTLDVYFNNIDKKLKLLDDILILNKNNNEHINLFNDKVEKHILINNNSNKKGLLSECKLEKLLNSMFPNSEICNTSKTSHSGDIILYRKNKFPILFENKNYEEEYNVPTIEVNKFYNDLKTKQIDGIFLSQKSGICNKDNFEIEIINNNFICVFVHNCNYDSIKIQNAIDIIDNIKIIIIQTNNTLNSENYIISNLIIDKLKNDYLLFIKNKNEIINNMRKSNTEYNNHFEKNIKDLENININELKIYLSSYFSFDNNINNDSDIVVSCSICNKSFKNKKSLKCHISKSKCKNNILL